MLYCWHVYLNENIFMNNVFSSLIQGRIVHESFWKIVDGQKESNSKKSLSKGLPAKEDLQSFSPFPQKKPPITILSGVLFKKDYPDCQVLIYIYITPGNQGSPFWKGLIPNDHTNSPFQKGLMPYNHTNSPFKKGLMPHDHTYSPFQKGLPWCFYF